MAAFTASARARAPTERLLARMDASVAAASSGVGAWDDNFCLRLSICDQPVIILIAVERRGMQAQQNSQSWQAQQQAKITTHKQQQPDLPGNHRCAGDCTIPVPTPPIQKSTEGFRNTKTSLAWAFFVGVAVVAMFYVNRLRR